MQYFNIGLVVSRLGRFHFYFVVSYMVMICLHWFYSTGDLLISILTLTPARNWQSHRGANPDTGSHTCESPIPHHSCFPPYPYLLNTNKLKCNNQDGHDQQVQINKTGGVRWHWGEDTVCTRHFQVAVHPLERHALHVVLAVLLLHCAHGPLLLRHLVVAVSQLLQQMWEPNELAGANEGIVCGRKEEQRIRRNRTPLPY